MSLDTPIETLIDAVSGPDMMLHLQEFARWRKHAGTPGELESLRYVRRRLDDYGYRTELISHDAYISLPGAARLEALGSAMRAITHSFSRPSPAGGARGLVVDLGGGGERDFASCDVDGKIVLIDGVANPAASRRASLAGAIGQVHVSPHEHLHEMCISPVWGSPSHETVADLPSTVVITIPADEGGRLRRALAEGPVTASVHAEVDTGWRPTPILIADLPSRGGPEEEPFVLFTGHHDTWYYGVMDNGGANATMLEVARLCARHRDAWCRGLRVVFWSGHSQGRYSSSTWYADAHWEELEARAVAHVNVDSTGGMGNTVVADTTASAELGPLARDAIRARGAQEFSGRRMQRAGDQAFWGIGVPSIFGNMSEQPAGGEANASAAVFGGGDRLGHGTGWWWHTPDDTLDKIDEEILVRDTRIYLHVVWRLLSESPPPLDYAEHGRALAAELAKLQDAAGDRFDLSLLIDRARRLAAAAERLAGHRGSAAARVERCQRDLGRVLVPIDYTRGDRFAQDPALAQDAIPALQPLRRLRDLDPDGDEARFLLVGMTRARTRVGWALKKANALLERCLAELEEGRAPEASA